jgi:hypothetical protein
MRNFTSNTDEAIRNEFGRRGFLRLAGSVGCGAIIYSQTGPISLEPVMNFDSRWQRPA